MTKVKICGLTNLHDAQLAAQCGADMLGFILYPRSPRYVTPNVVNEITTAIKKIDPKIRLVGVFVNETAAHILNTLRLAKLDIAQLSGDEPVETLRDLLGMAYQAVRTYDRAQLILANQNRAVEDVNMPNLLLDASHPMLYGGSGTLANESLATSLASQCRLLLAGGLKPGNVSAALTAVHPWGVDVSSGVELSPGKKDPAQIEAFIRAVREYDRDSSR